MSDATDSRERIVSAALELFCARGYSAVGTQEICAKAGVLKGTLYHHFPTKMDVALAALSRYGEGLAARFEAIAASAEPAEAKLAAVFGCAHAAAGQDKAERHAVFGCLHGNLSLELSAQDERMRSHLDAITERWVDALLPIAEELARAGRAAPGDPRLAVKRVLAYLHGVVLMAKSANDPELIPALSSTALGLLAG